MTETQAFDCWAILEEWRPVIGFEKLYEVSDHGRVRRIGRAAKTGKGQGGGVRIGRILKVQKTVLGRPFVQLWKDGHYYNRQVHTLVSQAFLGPVPEGHEVNHIDGNKENNSPSNLEYVTRSANNAHAYRLGLRPSGEKHRWAKLSAQDVMAIRREYVPGKVGCRRLARKFNVAKKTITLILTGRTWKYLEE